MWGVISVEMVSKSSRSSSSSTTTTTTSSTGANTKPVLMLTVATLAQNQL